jgi:ADP-heptose:LPS heptosyltransferase
MRMKILKFVDHWCGQPLCIILGAIHRITHPFYKVRPKTPLKETPVSILAIKFFGLGSIVLASRMLKSVKIKYPHARIIFLTFKNNEDLVRRLQIADEIKTIDSGSLFRLLRSIFITLIYFSLNKPTISIDLEFFSKFSTIMSYLSGARWRAGFYIATFWRKSLVNVPVYFNYARHILEIYSMVGRAIGIETDEPLTPCSIPFTTEEESYVTRLMKEKNITESDLLLGINVNASDLAYCRKWPREKFAEVITVLLREDKGLKIFLTGTLNEREYTGYVSGLLAEDIRERVFDLSGVLNFGQFMALLYKLHIFLTNDSGPLHLAGAQGTRIISIWGPGSPYLYGPYGQERSRHRVIYKNLACSPCLYIYRTDAAYFCKGSAPCLENINVDEVVQAIRETIRELNF